MSLRSLSLISALAAALAGCSKPEPPKEVKVDPPVPVSEARRPLFDAGPDAGELKQHMFKHFAAVSELQRAIARGHLDEAKQYATWLLTHDDELLTGWQPFVDDVHAAAREVSAAQDLPTAGALAARLGQACASCHRARSAVVAFPWEPAPEEGPALRDQMKRHQWAAARLWEGLVGPSNEMWHQGAAALVTAELDVRTATSGTPRPDVAALAAKVRELAKRAGSADDLAARSKLYGELLSTCASCHQLVRPTPVPGP